MKKLNQNAAYAAHYSSEEFVNKVTRFGLKMGAKLLYNAYVLYLVLMSSDVPIKVKLEIIGALGYVIAPLDLIPDFIPIAGFSDDLAAISFAVLTARAYVTPDIQEKAKMKVYEIFGSMVDCELAA
jgi:uncharacterized membrane protein YkvA (DUF1232 family)